MSARTIDRPVIILGAPRAGTSILGRILQPHPAFVHLKEPRFVWRYGNDRRSDMLAAVHARPEVIAHVRGQFGKALAGDGTRLLEKTPSNSLRVPFIERIFPDAVYVHILRNGFDSAASIRSYWLNATSGVANGRIGDRKSILRQRFEEAAPRQIPFYLGELARRVLPAPKGRPKTLWGPRLPGLSQMVRDMELIEVAAMQWRECVELAALDGRALGPERYMELRLEELTLDKVGEVLAHAGLDMVPEVAAHFNENFEPSKHNSRRAGLSEGDLAHIRRIVTPTMQWLGYDEPGREAAE
jgi:hypothetical protein